MQLVGRGGGDEQRAEGESVAGGVSQKHSVLPSSTAAIDERPEAMPSSLVG